MREVCIVGVGMHKFGRFPGKSLEQMASETVRAALKDANMEWKDIQVAFCSALGGGMAAGVRIFSRVGQLGIPILNVETGGASAATACAMGARLIASGIHDTAIAVGATANRPRGFLTMTSYANWQMLMGLAVNPIHFGLHNSWYIQEYGITAEQVAKVSVKNHKNGASNPYAMYQKELTLEEVLNSPMVCYPIHLFELTTPNEGAAAVVLCAKELAHKYNSKPVKIASTSIRAANYGSEMYLSAAGVSSKSATIRNPEVTVETSREAYEVAGIGPEDLDIVECADGTAVYELIHCEELGLCSPGECGRLIDEGKTKIGGDIPVNTDGGMLAKGDNGGASLSDVCEVVWQLRDQAGARQVSGAKTGLSHVVGAGGNCTIVIFER